MPKTTKTTTPSPSPFDMSGRLFPNDKGDNEKRPDFRGDITIGGVKYSLAAWTKSNDKGEYLSIQVREWVDKPRDKDADPRALFTE